MLVAVSWLCLILHIVSIFSNESVAMTSTSEPEMGVTGRHGNNTGSGEEMPDEQRLLMKLLRSYDPGIRPVFNVSRSVVVNFSLTLVQIMDMVGAVLPKIYSSTQGDSGVAQWLGRRSFAGGLSLPCSRSKVKKVKSNYFIVRP